MKIPSSNLGRTCCVEKLFLTFRTIFVHNMFSPCSAKRRASDKDLPVRISIKNFCLFFFTLRNSFVHKLYDKGITLLAVTCDQGPSNVGVASEFNISVNNQKIPHPTIPGRYMFYFWDFPHLFKTCRNHLLGLIHI